MAMILFPFVLQAKTVKFTVNIPDAAYIQETTNYSVEAFNGETSIEVNYAANIDGVQIRPNAEYELVSVTSGDKTFSPYYGYVYINLDEVADGGTVAIIAQEKQPRIFTIHGNPDEVELSNGGLIYGKAESVDGAWTITDTSDYGSYMDITCVSGYVVESLINNANGQELLADYYKMKPRVSFYLSATDFPEGGDFTIKCTTLAAVRTVHVSIEVVDGEDSEIIVRRNGDYEPVPSSEWSDLALNPESELPLSISATDYNKSIYRIEVNGKNVEPEYGNFYLNNLTTGDKIKVWPNYPDADVPVKFTFVNKDTEGAIYDVYVNNERVESEVWQSAGLSVELGSRLGISFNTTGYQINSVTINGEPAPSTYSYDERVTSEEAMNFVIDATRYADYTVKLYYQPGTILVYNDYGTDNPIELPADADEVTLTIERSKNYLNIKPVEGYVISSSIDLLNDRDVYIPISITEDMEIAIYTEKFDRDNECVLYLAPNPANEDGSWNYASVVLSMRNSALTKQIVPEIGYNFFKYADVDRPFSISFYPSADIYINGIQSENQYGNWSGFAELEPNSVIKVYPAGTEVPTYKLTIDNLSDGGVEILADYINTLEGLEATVFGATDVEFVTVSAAEAEGQNAYIIKVNGEEVTANADGKTVAHIDADSTISIEVDPNVAITEITIGSDAPIYNLQGVRVSNPRGGIFIQNGRKIVR